MTGIKTDDLNQVMAKVKQVGRYPYDNLGKLSLAALLPLLFGGSIGPEAGLTGVIAGLCSWVGDRMRRFGVEFRQLTLLGTQAALTALFTAPVFGFVAPLAGSADGDEDPAFDEITIKLPKAQKTVVYGIAIAGGLGAYLLLGQLMGGGMGMPGFESAVVGNLELTWLIPLSLIGTICGWLYFVSEHASEALAHANRGAPCRQSHAGRSGARHLRHGPALHLVCRRDAGRRAHGNLSDHSRRRAYRDRSR